jgi:hypothetical protein
MKHDNLNRAIGNFKVYRYCWRTRFSNDVLKACFRRRDCDCKHRAEWLLSLSTDSSSIGPRVMYCTFNEIMNDDEFMVGTVFFLPSSHFCREKIHLCTSPMSRFHGQGAQPTKKIVYKTDYARQFAFFMNEVHHRRSLVPQ